MEKQDYTIKFHNFFGAQKYGWSIKDIWGKSLEKCDWIRGCVAYWTIDTSFFNKKLAKALSKDDSFFCVHLGFPTKLEALNEFHKEGAKLDFYNIFPKTEFAEGKRTAILHAKVTMFGYKNGEVEIWIGSYNMTPSALCEVNIEACTIIHTNVKSNIFKEVNSFLENTRDICEPYDPIKAKWLQIIRRKNLDITLTKEDIAELYGLEEHLIKQFFKTQVIILIGVQVDKLSEGKSLIQIIGMDNQFNEALSVKQKKVVLYVQDVKTNKFYYYMASVVLTGDIDLDTPDSYGIEFSKRRFAFLEKNLKGAILEDEKLISSEDLKKGSYVSSLKIESVIEEAQAFPFPTAVWADVVEPINVQNLSDKERRQLLKSKSKKEEVRFKESVPRKIQFKKLNPDLNELRTEITKDISVANQTDFVELVKYYREKLEEIQPELFESYEYKNESYLRKEKEMAAKKKSEFKKGLSKSLKFKQSPFGSIVVEKETSNE